MPCFEATKREHFLKIASFIASQPQEAVPLLCWQRGYRGRGFDADFIESLKSEMPHLLIFWVEDGTGKVRGVISLHERLTVEKVPLVTFAFVCIENEDWVKNDGTYFKEIFNWLALTEAPKRGLTKGEFFAMEKYAKWAKEVFGDTLEFVGSPLDAEALGAVYSFKVDIERYYKSKGII